MTDYSLQSVSFHILLHILQDNDGTTAVPVFAHMCTAPVFDDGVCTTTVFDDGGGIATEFATGDCSATANPLDPYTAN